MTENLRSPEEQLINREQVVDAFRKFPKRGITNPDRLPSDDQDVISANALLQVWDYQQSVNARRLGTLEAEFEHALSVYTIYTDAGFSDPNYLNEVANQWLVQDLQEAEDAGLTEVAAKIQAKIDEIRAKL